MQTARRCVLWLDGRLLTAAIASCLLQELQSDVRMDCTAETAMSLALRAMLDAQVDSESQLRGTRPRLEGRWPKRTESATRILPESEGSKRIRHPHPGSHPSPLERRVMAPNPEALLPASASKELAAV